MLLELKNLNVAYGHAKVLHNIFLRLMPGEIAFIVGRNGAGKTTLLKTIAGFIKPTEGSIVFKDNINLLKKSLEDTSLTGIRYIFQDKRVFTKLTVKDNIMLSAYASKTSLPNAIEKFTEFYPNINRMLNLKAGNLSGGQRQILLIGCALIGNPELLLIDEPTEGLAAVIINDIVKLLIKTKRKVSMLIVEQNLSIVRRLADRIYLMKEGKICKEVDDINNIVGIREEIEKYL